MVGMGIRMTRFTHLYQAQKSYTQSGLLPDPKGLDMQTKRVGCLQIGTEITEVGIVHHTSQRCDIIVKLMIAQSRIVETQLVHQRHHRLARFGILVVDRIAGTVVTGGK